MKPIVVDASVVIKWFVPEIHAAAAVRWASSGHPLLAPDLLFAEAGNIVWKKSVRGELSETEARRVRAGLSMVQLRTVPSRTLFEAALELALALKCTVYDALYVVLAVAENAVLVTADRKLHDTLSATVLKTSARWIEEEP